MRPKKPRGLGESCLIRTRAGMTLLPALNAGARTEYRAGGGLSSGGSGVTGSYWFYGGRVGLPEAGMIAQVASDVQGCSSSKRFRLGLTDVTNALC